MMMMMMMMMVSQSRVGPQMDGGSVAPRCIIMGKDDDEEIGSIVVSQEEAGHSENEELLEIDKV